MCGAGSPATHELVVPRSMPMTSLPVAKRPAEELQAGGPGKAQQGLHAAAPEASSGAEEDQPLRIPTLWKPAEGQECGCSDLPSASGHYDRGSCVIPCALAGRAAQGNKEGRRRPRRRWR